MSSGNQQLVEALQVRLRSPTASCRTPPLRWGPLRLPTLCGLRASRCVGAPTHTPSNHARVASHWMLQRSLNGMVGTSSGYVEALPAPVRTRISFLKELDGERAELHERYRCASLLSLCPPLPVLACCWCRSVRAPARALPVRPCPCPLPCLPLLRLGCNTARTGSLGTCCK